MLSKFQQQSVLDVFGNVSGTNDPNITLAKISDQQPEIDNFRGQDFIIVTPQMLQELARLAFHDMNLYLRKSHLQLLSAILDDKDASPNDRYVALELLKNANIAAGGIFPMCQDTGTAIVVAKKGKGVWFQATDDLPDDKTALAAGIKQCYAENNLRYSQLLPKAGSSFLEQNTGDNLPAQIEIYDEGLPKTYEFLFIAKGGGSANKSFLYNPPPSLLNQEALLGFLSQKLRELGTSACPPYHLAVVIGGTSAEIAMKAVKLASCRYLDTLPDIASMPNGSSHMAFRDYQLEHKILSLTQNLGIGAQFGGKYFCLDVRVIRLPRHSASLPIGIAVSCSADRQAIAVINSSGIFLEQLCKDPAEFLPALDERQLIGNSVPINLNQPMTAILKELNNCPIKTRVTLNGSMVVARDAAHARFRQMWREQGQLPQYIKDHPIYYAGPAKTPAGHASGSFGPTTAGRMDGYVEELQQQQASLVMLAKGNRSALVANSCARHGGFYLGSIGGPAAKLGRDNITKVEVIDFPELGMEAVRKITVKDLPAFVVIDNKGHDFYQGLTTESV